MSYVMHVINDILNMGKKIDHTNLFMNEVSSFEKNQICFGDEKKFDFDFSKCQICFVYLGKVVFGDKNLDLFLLHKIKSFGLKNIRFSF